ncbi:MAG: antitoxin [Campylobacterales bacterium]
MTVSAKVFKNGRSQAIRLPKEYRVDSDEVYIEKIGHSLVIVPKEKSKWDIMRNAVEDLDGLELERDQPALQDRDIF